MGNTLVTPGANFINEFTTCFCLKTSYEVRTLKIGFHQTIELCELLTFCRIFKTKYLGVAAYIFVLNITNLLLRYQGCCISHDSRDWRAKNRQRFNTLKVLQSIPPFTYHMVYQNEKIRPPFLGDYALFICPCNLSHPFILSPRPPCRRYYRANQASQWRNILFALVK